MQIHLKKNIMFFLGESGVGSKTSLINRLANDILDINVCSTSSYSYFPKLIKLKNGKEIIINLWDTVGHEKYRSLAKIYMKDVDCVVLGYDITKNDSFENIKNVWFQYSKEIVETDLYYLIANKTDLFLKEEVDESEARNYAKENNMRFFLVSCYDSLGIDVFLNDLITEIVKI